MPARVRSTLAIAAILAVCGTVHGQFYEYKIIAKDEGDLIGMGDGPSINNGLNNNDEPLVAFTGQMTASPDAYEGIFVGDGHGNAVNISEKLTKADQNLSPTCQINELGVVAVRWTSPNDNGPTYTHLWTFDWRDPNKGIKIADSTAQNPFRSINTDVTINNAGKLVWSGLNEVNKELVATGVWGNYKSKLLPSTPVRPIFASEADLVVMRNGNLPTDQILLRDATMNVPAYIASSANFTSLGQSPGISADGNIVVFAGDLSGAGAAALNAAQANWDYGQGGRLLLVPLQPGPGIFASVKTTLGRVIVRIAGVCGNGILDPGEYFNDENGNGVFDIEFDWGPCTSFEFNDMRVAIDGSLANQRALTVCYSAKNFFGKQGLYSNRLSVLGSGEGPYDPLKPGRIGCAQTAIVIEAGDSIPDFGIVESIGTYDPLNARDRGDIAFYAKNAVEDEAIVLARPQQVVFLDFDAINNYVLNNDSAGVFEDAGLPVGWFGDMAMVFAYNAPDRDDLNSPAALKAIQDGIVDDVQRAFDELEPGGHGVNVKVFGKVGESAPEGGPFIRVSIGDGGHTDENPSALNATSAFDVFNEGTNVLDDHDVYNFPIRGDVRRGGPLVFVDTIFRDQGGFTNGDINNPVVIPLSDTGPHMITQQQVIWAMGGIIAHEVGHSFGLGHIHDDLNDLVMNARGDSAFSGTVDEKRLKKHFGQGPHLLDPAEFNTGGSVDCSARLAMSVGTDIPSADLKRDPPPIEELNDTKRYAYSLSADLNQSLNVAVAGIGIVSGYYDAAPRFINLGSGDLEGLLNREIEIGAGDFIIIFASTKGEGVDVFGVKAGFGGDVSDVTLESALQVMSSEVIRCDILDNDENPLKEVMDIYQRKDNGDMVLLGSVGDPGGNAGPVAKNDQANMNAGDQVVISVLANDTDADGLDMGSLTIAHRTLNGGIEVNPATGKITYRAAKGFDGVDTFRYTVRDTKGAVSNEATVTITVAGGDCYADFTGDGTLDLFDFLGFVNAFNAQDQKADCIDDNAFDLFDFLCFVNAFNGGC